eukprot:TRINITY_DN7710_c0_g2_i2.p1 TRINITY_DN7710_c0_g2~~TRINITY_DN7710_c0_g2_i2.p1  ORF type:complete len:293 (-),score=23.73 TRINITY_DN7710_c0_g2_i2:195-1043(-)
MDGIEDSSNKCKFRDLLEPHRSCDVILVCPSRPMSRPQEHVKFYCHFECLARCCGAIASMHSFDASAKAATTRIAQLKVPASADVVYEVLRYAYTGDVLPVPGFRERLAEFLVAVDYLGVCDFDANVEDVLRERVWDVPPKSSGSIFDALFFQEMFERISNDEIREAFRHRTVEAPWPSEPICVPLVPTGSDKCFVGFKTRQIFLAKVAEHRLRAAGGPPPSDPDWISDAFPVEELICKYGRSTRMGGPRLYEVDGNSGPILVEELICKYARGSRLSYRGSP